VHVRKCEEGEAEVNEEDEIELIDVWPSRLGPKITGTYDIFESLSAKRGACARAGTSVDLESGVLPPRRRGARRLAGRPPNRLGPRGRKPGLKGGSEGREGVLHFFSQRQPQNVGRYCTVAWAHGPLASLMAP
jgi:hypothetical protein